ncbi:hypothetical protein DMENIID0001_065480 [Sergentomyia squamirostris]
MLDIYDPCFTPEQSHAVNKHTTGVILGQIALTWPVSPSANDPIKYMDNLSPPQTLHVIKILHTCGIVPSPFHSFIKTHRSEVNKKTRNNDTRRQIGILCHKSIILSIESPIRSIATSRAKRRFNLNLWANVHPPERCRMLIVIDASQQLANHCSI